MISIIAAVDRKRGIGYQNRLLFWLPNDLKRFKALTTGNTIIMGRKTFESLPKGALPNRRNVVLSTQKDLICPDAEVFSSLEEALNSCQPDEHVYIIGGASVYRQALPLCRCPLPDRGGCRSPSGGCLLSRGRSDCMARKKQGVPSRR